MATTTGSTRHPSSKDRLAEALSVVLDPTAAPGAAPPGGCLAVRTPTTTRIAVLGDRQRIGIPTPQPMTRDAAVDVGSVTKIIGTTAAVMALIDHGSLTTSDRLGRFLPGLTALVAELTIDQVLLHRAGLWEWWPLYLGTRTHAATITQIGELPLRYRPGAARHYSDLGFLLLGAVVSVACGSGSADSGSADSGLAAAVQDLVLGPVGLTSTGYGLPRRNGPVVASSVGDRIERRMIDDGVPYPVPGDSTDFDGWREHVLVGEVNDGNAFHGCGGTAGHAGLFSTVPDLLIFATALLDSLDGTGPLSRATLSAFLTAGPDAGQARGFRIETSTVGDCTAAVYSHPGFPGVSLAIIPRHRAGVVLSTNRLHVEGVPRRHEPSWRLALGAAHQLLHEDQQGVGTEPVRCG